MVRFNPDAEIAALGEALASLRRASGLNQSEAGARAGMTSQAWGLYEGGRRPGLFRPDVQRRLTAALSATPEDLALMLPQTAGSASIDAGRGVRNAGRPFASASLKAAAPIERLSLSTDELSPWASSGVMLEIDPGRWPRRDQGCVIDLVDGTRIVRLYVGADAERITVRGGPAGLSHEVSLERASVARIAVVRARLDE